MKFEEYILPKIILEKKRKKSYEGMNLYHYTSLEGVRGIVESKSIRATNICYLNDSDEYIHVYKSANKLLKSDGSHRGEKYKEFFDMSIKYLSSLKSVPTSALIYNPVFVSCFSDHPNDLSQWRAYCRNGGYQMGFSIDFVEQIAPSNSSILYPCIYDDDEKDEIIVSIIGEVIDKAYRNDESPERIYKIANDDFLNQLGLFAPIFKNSNFSNEREWRLYSEIAWWNSKQRFFSKNGMFVPYIDISLEVAKKFEMKNIMVGPMPDKTLAYNSLKSFLRSNVESNSLKMNLENVEISDIPYRQNW